jgi:hypothetical protein
MSGRWGVSLNRPADQAVCREMIQMKPGNAPYRQGAPADSARKDGSATPLLGRIGRKVPKLPGQRLYLVLKTGVLGRTRLRFKDLRFKLLRNLLAIFCENARACLIRKSKSKPKGGCCTSLRSVPRQQTRVWM